MKKICFIGNLSSTFVKRDHEILSKHFKVETAEPPKKILGWVSYLVRIAKKVKKSDIVFAWFAGWHSAPGVFFSNLFGKKSVVVVGGYDCANIPELGYGAFAKGRFLKEGMPAKYVFKHADKILVVESSLKEDIVKNAKMSGDNIEYLPTGYDSDYWTPDGKKENIALTVGGGGTLQRIKIKGLDTFVKAAAHLPDIKFIVVGVFGDAKKYLESIASDNVELIGFLGQDELREYYRKAKVYCQLSIREGLPNTLCEAMLCGCVPVGTDSVPGIRAAMGDTGFYVPYGNVKATADTIRGAFDCFGDKNLVTLPRKKIMKMFSVKKREEYLNNFVLGI